MKSLLTAFLISATVAVGADPFDGTWKQSNERSGGQVHKKHEVPPVLKIEVLGEKATIQNSEMGYTVLVALDGTPTRQTTGKSAGTELSVKRVHPSVWSFHRDRPGSTDPSKTDALSNNEEGYYTVSADGKTLTLATLRKYSDGSTRYYLRVFEKQ